MYEYAGRINQAVILLLYHCTPFEGIPKINVCAAEMN
jgi:hypothetical protein